jgi:single-stranded DNA-binding protein
MEMITIIGNMGDFAKVTQFENGAKVARFQLASHFGEDTTWHRMFAWGTVALFIEKFGRNGKKMMIKGRKVVRTYLDREGIQKQVEEIEVREIVGL